MVLRRMVVDAVLVEVALQAVLGSGSLAGADERSGRGSDRAAAQGTVVCPTFVELDHWTLMPLSR